MTVVLIFSRTQPVLELETGITHSRTQITDTVDKWETAAHLQRDFALSAYFRRITALTPFLTRLTRLLHLCKAAWTRQDTRGVEE